MKHIRVMSFVLDQPWAITPEGMEQILQVLDTRELLTAANEHAAHLDAVAAKLGRPLDNTGGTVEQRGSTAILSVEGPIFRYANLFTMLSGATSVDMLALGLQAALDNPQIENVVFNFNSPGGQLEGINGLADQIRAGAAKKPIYAYIDGQAASAAYWLAAATNKIVSDESGMAGSIGVQASVYDSSAKEEKAGMKKYTIISSQSPRKNMPVSTEGGRQALQDIVDAAAELFIGRVAAFRGTTPETVQADYGAGGVYFANRALKAGMIDAVQPFESFLASLEPAAVSGYGGVRYARQEPATSAKETLMEDPKTPAPPPLPAATAPTPEQIQAGEQARIKAILTGEHAAGRTALAQHLAFGTRYSVAESEALLQASPKEAAAVAPTQAPTSFERAMARVPNPQVGASGTEEDDPTGNSEVNRILAFVPQQRRAS